MLPCLTSSSGSVKLLLFMSDVQLNANSCPEFWMAVQIPDTEDYYDEETLSALNRETQRNSTKLISPLY